MFQGHQYFVARGRHLEVFNIDENVNKRLNKLNVILGDKMTKFEAGDTHFLLKELQAAADALNTQVEFKRQNSVSYSEAPETGTQDGFSTAINWRRTMEKLRHHSKEFGELWKAYDIDEKLNCSFPLKVNLIHQSQK